MRKGAGVQPAAAAFDELPDSEGDEVEDEDEDAGVELLDVDAAESPPEPDDTLSFFSFSFEAVFPFEARLSVR